MNKKDQKSLVLVLGLALLIVAVSSVAFGIYSAVSNSDKNKISTGVIKFNYIETSELLISMDESLDDNDGKLLNDYFAFNVAVDATGKVDLAYYIYITPQENNTLDANAVRIYLSSVTSEAASVLNETQVVAPTKISSLLPVDIQHLEYDEESNDLLLHVGSFSFNNENIKNHYYRLRLWIDPDFDMDDVVITDIDDNHSATITGGTFKLKVNVYSHAGTPENITAP